MIDAMAIRKQVQYDSHTKTMTGFVDLGVGTDESKVASEALVFMLGGLVGYLKVPIAYFLTATLTPDTQKVLLEHTLRALHERVIKVVCLTMDGHKSNVSMCHMFGCQLKLKISDQLKTYFPHPSTSEPVYVIMLARNISVILYR